MASSEEYPPVSETPILDSGVLPPRTRKKSWGNVIAGFAVGSFFGFVMIVGERVGGDLYPGQGLLVFITALALPVAVHEFGHLLAGWAQGFRFSFVAVGPVSVRLQHGLLKIRVRREMRALGYAGMHVCGVRRLRRRMLVYVAAGSAANLLSLPLALFLTNRAFPLYSWGAAFAAEFVMISVMLFALNVLPLGSRSSSDGSRIAMLLRSRERTRRWITTIAVGGQKRKGTRAKDWRQTWLRAATSLHDNSVDEFSGTWLAYISASAKEDAALAAAHLERCLQLVHLLRPSIRDLVAQEAAVFTAWFWKDAPLAEKWVSQIKKPKLIQHLPRIRVKLALCCAHRDFAGAGDIWQQGFTFIEKLPATLSRDRLRESWLEWQGEIQERQNEPVTT
jgi:hypothetical protein